MGNVNIKTYLLEQRAVTCTFDQREGLGITVLDYAGNLTTNIKILQKISTKGSSCKSLTSLLIITPVLNTLKPVLIRAIFLHSS